MTEQDILEQARIAARERAQERAQERAAKVAREIAENGAAKEPDGDRATATFTRAYNHSFPILYEQYFQGFLKEETKKQYEMRLVGPKHPHIGD
jgi:hypothetical protein